MCRPCEAWHDAPVQHASAAQLSAGLEQVLDAPREVGRVELIVCRPGVEERTILVEGDLDAREGLVGDNWLARGSTRTEDGRADPAAQLTVMGARAIALFAGRRDRWELAGDQIFVDFDISHANLPAGTRLELGSAVVEVSAKPHLGCQKFSRRFGLEALKLVNSETGRALRLRGLNARIVVPGRVRVGDSVRKSMIEEETATA